MFKLAKIHIIDHPFFGELDFDFVSKGEESNGPYTSVLINKNGTGKSLIFRNIADIFEDLKNHFLPAKGYRSKISYSYKGQLFYNKIFIDFDYKPVLTEKTNSKDLSKRRYEFHFYNNEKSIWQSEDLSPQKLAVSAYLVSDKFRFASKDKKDFYVYLGLRQTANSAGTKSFLNRIIPYVIDYIKDRESLKSLEAALEFLEFDKNFFEIEYKGRYKYHFFSGNLDEEELEELLTNWETFSRRKSPPRYLDYYNYSVKGKTQLLKKIAVYLNELSRMFEIRVKRWKF